MLHSVPGGARPASDGVLRAMFAARKRVFVDLLGWDVPVIDGQYEVDQFDNEHAHYLILTDDDCRHLGSARLLPTTRPHILGDLYPELCEAGPPRGPGIYEITRFCLDRNLSARERRAVRDALVTAIAEYGLANGISAYSAIAEMGWLQQILAFGWRCCPLGLPKRFGGQLLGALSIDIDARTPCLLAAAGILARSDLLTATMLAAA